MVDTSAAVAILTGEADGATLIDALDRAESRMISAATLVELGIALKARFGPVGMTVTDRFVTDARIDVVPVDREQAGHAVAAWRRFGRGRHRAALNYGDCFTYALAAAVSAPILCTGDDFSSTDLEVIVG